MPKVKTAISIDNELLARTTSLADELDVSRSQVISEAIEEYLRNYHNQKLLHQINEAYSNYPDADEDGALKIIESHRKKPGALDEWK